MVRGGEYIGIFDGVGDCSIDLGGISFFSLCIFGFVLIIVTGNPIDIMCNRNAKDSYYWLVALGKTLQGFIPQGIKLYILTRSTANMLQSPSISLPRIF